MLRFRIDWPNHIIGFFIALFGILIAFELDEWREQKKELALAKSAFENIKKEVDINQNILHENISLNLKTIRKVKEILIKVDRNLLFTGSREEADSINKKFGKLLFIDVPDESRAKSGWPLHVGLGNIIVPSLHSSAWESAKAIGALNFMPYEKVVSLSFVYNNSRINDELLQIKGLIKNADQIMTKNALRLLLDETERSHKIIEDELVQFDQFVNMLEAMD